MTSGRRSDTVLPPLLEKEGVELEAQVESGSTVRFQLTRNQFER